MYEQDMIFGPLTFKQFTVLVIGCGLSWYLYKYSLHSESLQIYIYTIIVFIMAFSFHLVLGKYKNPKIPLDKVPAYFAGKKLKMLPLEYEKMIIQKVVGLGFQIQMRKTKGLPDDLSLNKLYEIMLSEYDIINPNLKKSV